MAIASLDAGWDFAKIGTATGTFTTIGSVSFSSGRYSHIDLQNVMGSGSYDDFATALDTALGGTYSVTWSSTTGLYTIARGTAFTATFTGAAGTIMKAILGLTGDIASTTSKTSDVLPYYHAPVALGVQGPDSYYYEPDGMMREAEADDGTVYQISRYTAPRYRDLTIGYETQARCFAVDAAAASPWTFEHLHQHCRTGEPFIAQSGGSGPVFKLRGDGGSFKPQPFFQNMHTYWNVPLRLRQLGVI